jgi:SAM-dependent methyltransferase
VYARLARAVVGDCPLPLDGARVLDLGAGTGVVSELAAAAGATVVAADLDDGMLRHDQARRPPATRADALALPFRGAAFDAVLAACLVNHFERPAIVIEAAAATVRPGGAVVASVFAAAPDPVKEAIDAVARRHGWVQPEWHAAIKQIEGTLGSPASLVVVGRDAGLRDVVVREHAVALADLAAEEAVAYRLALVHLAPWAGTLAPAARAELVGACAEACRPVVGAWAMRLLVLAGRVS